jgi:hypothetical protein
MYGSCGACNIIEIYKTEISSCVPMAARRDAAHVFDIFPTKSAVAADYLVRRERWDNRIESGGPAYESLSLDCMKDTLVQLRLTQRFATSAKRCGDWLTIITLKRSPIYYV